MAMDEIGVLLSAMQNAENDDQLHDVTARQVQRLTGFDRVMVYKFDEDLNGAVVAEAVGVGREEAIGSFLGLNYPASDIPAQAHQLYLKNWLRLIPDIGYQPVPILGGDTADQGKLDLSYAALRSVSPIHLEYLQNMGVTATLTVSLPDQRPAEPGAERRLWGLIACHHYSGPHYLDHSKRSICELIGRQASSSISISQIRRRGEDLAHRRGVQQKVVSTASTGLGEGAKLPEALIRRGDDLMSLVDATGVVVTGAGMTLVAGDVPSLETVEKIHTWVRSRVEGEERKPHIIKTDRLTQECPELADDEEARHLASGVLALPLSLDGPTILWFRPEMVHVVEWGGNPQNNLKRMDNGRLAPRKSFERWQQQVHGRSRRWEAQDVAAALELRSSLVDIVVRYSERLEALNDRLEQSNRELTRFAYAAGHDLREPIRGINSLASFTLEDYGDTLDPEVSRRLEVIKKLTVRTDTLMKSLLRYAELGQTKIKRTSFALSDVIEEVRETVIDRLEQRSATLRYATDLPTVSADRDRIYEVLQNLIVNALKYAGDAPPLIEVGVSGAGEALAAADTEAARAEVQATDDHLFIYVRDAGIGIPPAQRQDVFRIFRRLHARDAHGGGSGAGLTICRQAVERHGGRMWITGNQHAEFGITVWFTLGS